MDGFHFLLGGLGWFLALLSGLFAIQWFGPWVQNGLRAALFGPKKDPLELAVLALDAIRVELELGRPIELSEWGAALSVFWRCRIERLIEITRESGGALLPVLRPFRESLEKLRKTRERIKTKTSGVWLQMGVLGALVPVLLVAVGVFVPEVFEREFLFLSLICIVMLMNGAAVLWIYELGQSVLRAGLSDAQKEWALEGAVVLALLRSLISGGRTPDWAWSEAVRQSSDSSLREYWGIDVWAGLSEEGGQNERCRLLKQWHGLIFGLSVQIKDAILRGGKTLESVSRTEERWFELWEAELDRSVEKLPVKLLFPLFFCIVPSLMGVIVFSVWCAVSTS